MVVYRYNKHQTQIHTMDDVTEAWNDRKPDELFVVHADIACLDALAAIFQLPDKALQRIKHSPNRPQLKQYDGCQFCIINDVYPTDDAENLIATGKIYLFTRDQYCLIFTQECSQSTSDKLDQHLTDSHPPNASHLLLDCLNLVSMGYQSALQELESGLQDIEAKVFSPHDKVDVSQIYMLEREALEADRAINPLPNIIYQLTNSQERDDDHDLRELQQRVEREEYLIGNYRELLRTMLNAYLARVGVQQNDDMRKISAWVAILAVPTAMSAVWGMNFKHMPELNYVWTYPVALGLMALSCLFLYYKFKKAKWL